jgi:Icc-related predicted phosphoesterase
VLSKTGKEKNFTRLFFVTDIHGSEVTFRKFLSAGEYYEADVVMLCGDLTGKMLVTVVEGSDGTYTSWLFGQEQKAQDEKGLRTMEEKISDAGYYPFRTDDDGMIELKSHPEKADELFKRLMLERLDRWVKMAGEHYRDSGIKCVITGGNDDPLEIESVLNSSNYVMNSDNKLMKLDDSHEMITVGQANVTPWKCPRDVSEETLKRIIENLATGVQDMKNCVFNLHAPPKDSTIDTALKLDDSVYPPRPVTKGGQPVSAGAGSSVVRESIEKYQPLLGLHGHIHESRGVTKIGRTLCINPGSEYGEGILRGAIVNIAKSKVLSHQLTSG